MWDSILNGIAVNECQIRFNDLILIHCPLHVFSVILFDKWQLYKMESLGVELILILKVFWVA